MLIIVQVDNGPRSLPSTSAPSPHSPDATTPHQAAQHRPTNQSIIYSNPHASKKPPLRALPRDLNEAILGHPGLKPVNRESLSKEMNEFLVQRRRAQEKDKDVYDKNDMYGRNDPEEYYELGKNTQIVDRNVHYEKQ